MSGFYRDLADLDSPMPGARRRSLRCPAAHVGLRRVGTTSEVGTLDKQGD